VAGSQGWNKALKRYLGSPDRQEVLHTLAIAAGNERVKIG